jgi:Protein of unknown function (DUF732)
MQANNTQRMLAALSAIALAIGLGISAAPAAHGDENDDAFLLALKRHGIVPADDPGALVTWAHWACDQLGQGAKKEHVVAWLMQFHFSDSGAHGALEGMFLREAALYYCPEHKESAGW